MPIRPIDMQVALPRVTEVKESKSNHLHRDDISHSHSNKSMQEETIKKQKSVNKMDASSKTRVNERKNKHKDKDQEKEDDAEKRSNKSSYDEDGNYHIDIKI